MTKQEKKGLQINFIIDQSNYTPLHVHDNLFMDIDINKKQEALTFFDVFISMYLSKYFSEYSDESFEYEPDSIRLIFKDKVNLNNKQRGRLFNRLHGMVKQAEAYFKYLDYYRLNFNQKGVEYYLRLRSLGKHINKDTLLKRSVITLDVDHLKIYNNFFNRKKAREDVEDQNKKLTKFQETVSEIYLDAVDYLKSPKEQIMTQVKEQPNPTNVKVFKPNEIIEVIVNIDVTYNGGYDRQYRDPDIANRRLPSYTLYLHGANNKNIDYTKIFDKLQHQLNDTVLIEFNSSLEKYLGPLSKLYNFKNNVSCVTTTHWCKNRDYPESNEVKLSIKIEYYYKRNLDILVREDDEIKSKLQRFIEHITKYPPINLDSLEFNV